MTNTTSIAKANAAFRNGDYRTAENIYRTLLSHGGVIQTIAKTNIRLIRARTREQLHPDHGIIDHKNIKPIIDSLKSSDGNLVITYPIIPWSFRIQRPQHLVGRLSKQGFTSLYLANVAPPTLPSTENEILDCLGTRELAAGVHEVWLQTEQGFNMYKTEICGRNLEEMTLQLETICNYLKPNKLIHLIQFPGWAPLAEEVKQVCGGMIVYDCMDHHAGFTNNTGEALSQEDRLIRKADLVLASSLLLERELKPRAKQVLLIKNATEFEHFRNPRPNGRLDHLKGPIIGYYGAIADWFDIDLVVECAKQRPDCNFVMIGSTDLCDTSRAKEIRNIHFLGEIPYRDLPGYLSYFDVCTIPFKIIPLTKATNPVKFYEYMSAGKPVVSTELPELQPYSEFVYFASDSDQFGKQIDKALSSGGMSDLMSARQRLAANNDWNARTKVILNHKIFFQPKPSYRCSIILVSYNELENTTKPCIESILNNTPEGEYELIIVDNHSTKDETKAYLTQVAKEHPQIKIKLNNENRGFSGGNNDGLIMSTGEFVVLLNNDTLVTRGWLDRLIQPFYSDSTIGLVGPITNSAGGTQRIEIWEADVDNIINKLTEYSDGNKQTVVETHKLGFFCVAMRSRLVAEIGFLDESFGVGMFEDDEFCHRAKAAGYKCVINEGCYVYHKGSASFSKLKTKTYEDLFIRNKGIFKEKTGCDWTFSQILQEYIDYIKFSVNEARNDQSRAAKYMNNISARMQSIEWLSSHIRNLEINSPVRITASTTTGTNTRPRSISNEDLLDTLGYIRNKYIVGKRLIVFSPTVDWNYMTQRPQQLAKAFAARGFAVIYSTFNAQADSVDFYDITPDGVLIINQAFMAILHHLIIPSESIFFCVWPNNLHYAEVVPHSTMVYDILDDISLLQGNQHELKTRHLEAMSRATIISVSSQLLYEDVPQRYRNKTILVKNAVAEKFANQAKRQFQDQPDINDQEILRSKLDQKVVGYVGAVAEWMDFGLIELLLRSFPAVSFVFVGPILPDGQALKGLALDYDNIVLIGEKKHDELPFFIRQFDVCIIPFLLNRITHAVSPVKLFEYAAFGKPIITTAMRECIQYKSVNSPESHSEFVMTLKRILDEESAICSDDVYQLAQDNTWEKRVDVLLDRIYNCGGDSLG